MEAIILAGGYGTRLRPLTYTRAKSLLPIMNQPMVSYLMRMLPSEVSKVILAVNYRKDQIEEYFKQQTFGKEIIVNDEPKPLGTGGAVKFAEKHISGPFFVLNADIICSLDISKMIKYHKKKKAAATISLWPVERVSEFGVVDIKQNGNVISFVEKPKPEDAPSNLINAGAYYLQPEVLDYIATGRLVSMEKEIFPQIISDTGRFYGYQLSGYWIDVGRIQSYIDVHKLLLTEKNTDFIMGKHTMNRGIATTSCLGNHVTIHSGVHLSECVVLDHSIIDKNSSCTHCVIGENVQIGEDVLLRNVVVGDAEDIAAETKLENSIVWNQSIPEDYPKKQIGNVIGE
ncbi:MAG: NDP-sugar synthase [Candidatus Thermoplasmatota archaeon]|nr:NDP-sugar synthase [Candidatus Thermoplasmatota archaeon]MBU1941056.1 NDP-sugar synthase [Candidatus Thermoplasmatota archaeon]